MDGWGDNAARKWVARAQLEQAAAGWMLLFERSCFFVGPTKEKGGARGGLSGESADPDPPTGDLFKVPFSPSPKNCSFLREKSFCATMSAVAVDGVMGHQRRWKCNQPVKMLP